MKETKLSSLAGLGDLEDEQDKFHTFIGIINEAKPKQQDPNILQGRSKQ